MWNIITSKGACHLYFGLAVITTAEGCIGHQISLPPGVCDVVASDLNETAMYLNTVLLHPLTPLFVLLGVGMIPAICAAISQRKSLGGLNQQPANNRTRLTFRRRRRLSGIASRG